MTTPSFRTSTIPAYVVALLEALRGAEWPVDDVRVHDGEVAPDRLGRRYVLVGDTTDLAGDSNTDWAMLGNGRKTETYTLVVTIGAGVPADSDMRAAREQAFAMLGVLEHVARGALNADEAGRPRPQLVAGVQTVIIRRGPHQQDWTNEGPLCRIFASVEVTASLERLT